MFVTYFYQPFFNLLVGIYWLLSKIGPEFADMGIAVIVFAIIVRVLTFPLTVAGERSEEEKRKIVEHVEALKRQYSSEPIRLKIEIKKVIRGNARTVIATTANLAIQLLIILMLYRIFATGLEGRDFHLLYDFMPRIEHVNLLFLGKYDLSHTNATLNLLQSAMIFVVELLIALRSPFPVSRRDVALLQFILPLGSYLIFMALPAGKKVFIIASLCFSAVYHTVRLLQTWSKKLIERFTPKPPPAQEESISSPSDPPTN
jgi:YidC/Oxa1 family membrane protein insertase